MGEASALLLHPRPSVTVCWGRSPSCILAAELLLCGRVRVTAISNLPALSTISVSAAGAISQWESGFLPPRPVVSEFDPARFLISV